MLLPYFLIFSLILNYIKPLSANLSDPTFEKQENTAENLIIDDPIKNIWKYDCTGYSLVCLKLGLVQLIKRGSGNSVNLFPGMMLKSSGISKFEPISRSSLLNNPERVDQLLFETISDYLESLSLNIKVIDKSLHKVADDYSENSIETGGRKKNKGEGMMLAILSGGSMLAIGMTALAAMAGKALMASLLALLLAGVSALKGGGGGGEGHKTTYEIVAKPVVSHHQTHSSEVVHAGHGGHYKRSFEPYVIAHPNYAI